MITTYFIGMVKIYRIMLKAFLIYLFKDPKRTLNNNSNQSQNLLEAAHFLHAKNLLKSTKIHLVQRKLSNSTHI